MKNYNIFNELVVHMEIIFNQLSRIDNKICSLENIKKKEKFFKLQRELKSKFDKLDRHLAKEIL